MNPSYAGLKQQILNILNHVPIVGDPVEKLLFQFKESVKAGLHGGMLFESLGIRYVGPVEGHNIPALLRYLKMVKDVDGPVLLHVVTEKGHGFQPAAADPVYFHTPAPFERTDEKVISIKASSSKAYTDVASAAVYEQLERNPRVTVLTAAMCQGNKLEKVRNTFPERFFDVGICESHAVAFAAGQAKAGLRPIVDIYSTFLQRSYDQLFQEVALQNLPVTFLLDRAGLTGPDGPTHHGCFDLGYLRLLPNMVVCAPGDAADLTQMLEFALSFPGPVAIRYPKAPAEDVAKLSPRQRTPIELGAGGGFQLGPRRRDPGVRHAFAELLESGGNAARRGFGRRRHQCPIRQAARYRNHFESRRNQPVRAGSGRGGADGGFRQCRAGSGIRRQADRRPRGAAGHSRPVYRTCRARRTAGGPRCGRRRNRAHLPRTGRARGFIRRSRTAPSELIPFRPRIGELQSPLAAGDPRNL